MNIREASGVEDKAAAVDAIVLAFAVDPMTRWTWPNPRAYLATMPGFVHAFAGGAFANGGAHCTGDGVAAALWLPPGVQPDDEAIGEIFERTVAAGVRSELFSIFERMAIYHPEGPHWYLPFVGVDPAHQGKGHGSALMQFALDRCDRAGVPAYLESSNPRNVPLYQRHGFEVLGTIQVGGSPPVVPMLRTPR